MLLRRLPTLGDYLQCLRDAAAERQLLFEELLIPVTSFFREPECYEALQVVILPRLPANRPPTMPLRVGHPTPESHGTGLGLVISQRILEAHGGEIGLGDYRHGAEFVLVLPREE